MIFRRTVTPAGLAAAILTRPQGAWFYYGAVGLDDETRAWFRARPHRLLRIAAQAGAFAAFGPSLRVRGERVASPGGPAADPAVEGAGRRVAGRCRRVRRQAARRARPAGSPGSTTPSAGSMPGMQRHLLAGDGALDRLRRLADVFTRVNTEWRIEDRPLWRPLVDPATLLLELEARPDGSLALPEPAAWAGTFGRPEQVDAAWLVDRVFSGDRVGDPRSLRAGAVRDALDARRPRGRRPAARSISSWMRRCWR